MPRLIQQVSERTTVDKADVQAVFYAAFDEIYKAMLRNESVVVKGFGTFRLDYRVPSRGYCIIKNKVVEHPEKYAPAVKFERGFIQEARTVEVDPKDRYTGYKRRNRLDELE